MLQAESWSRFLITDIVRPGLSGEVHSRSDQGCNLLCDGHLIGLVDPLLGNGPYNITVRTPAGGYAASTGWLPGRAVSFQAGVLLLDGEPVVGLAGAAVWEPDPPQPDRTGDHSAAADKLGRTLQVLGQEGALHSYVLATWEGRAYKSGPLLLALPRLRELKGACLTDPVLAVAKALALVGLCDGFLTGLIATLVRGARWGMASEPVVRLSGALSEMALASVKGRTTLPSESMLKAATQGWLAEAPSNLATGLLAGVPGAMAHLPRTLAVGHADAASGIYAGLRILASDR